MIETVVRPLIACHRCGGELYLTATVAHPSLPGRRVLPLCPRCDANDPAAQGILAFFAVHSVVDSDMFAQMRELVAGWVAARRARPSGVDTTVLDADVGAWRAGELG